VATKNSAVSTPLGERFKNALSKAAVFSFRITSDKSAMGLFESGK